MDQDRYQRFSEIAARALARPASERAAYIADACGDDAELRAEVERVLDATRSDGFAETRIAAARQNLEASFVHAKTTPSDPETIDRYRIVRRIATGGMGVVYEAEQDHPKRRVAIKMIDHRRSSPALATRFRREADILGRLKHPGIAQIHDASAIDIGEGAQPYLVMEYVDGEPLTKHADAHMLDTRERLDLMARICDAVDYAHGQSIIHRDLKPDNVLVDSEGRPKVLDFGIARATEDATMVATQVTQDGQILGTLTYMAPEQLEGAHAETTPRTDVYALGVMLFELLAGHRPHDVAGMPLGSAVHLLSTEDTPTLGTIDTQWRGDVETIVSTALEKEPARRYASAAALATDIRRHLDDQPILARRASRIYRIRKFTRRNRALVVGGAATFLALVIGLVVAIALASSEREQRLASDRLSYRTSVLAATSALNELRPNQARRHLDDAPEDLRGWEWYELSSRLATDERVLDLGRPIVAALMGPDGTRFISNDVASQRMSIHDASTGQVRLEVVHTGRSTGYLFRNHGREIVQTGTDQGQHGEPIVWMEVRDAGDGRRLGGWSRDDLIASLDDLWSTRLLLGGTHCLLLTGRRVIALDAATGDSLRSVTLERMPQAGYPLSPNGQRAAIKTSSGVDILDVSSLSVEATLTGAGAMGEDFFFSPDARRLAAVAPEGPVHIWDLTSSPPVEIAVLPHDDTSRRIRFTPDGRTVVTGGQDRIVRIWNVDDGSLRRALPGHGAPISTIMLTPDARTLVTADASGEVRHWDLEGAAVRTLRGHASFVYSAAISPDGRRLITGGWDGYVGAAGTVRWWDLSTGAPVATRGTGICFGAILSHDGGTLAVVESNAGDAHSNARIALIDARNGGQRRSFRIDGAMAVSPFDRDDRSLAHVDRTSTLRVIDVQRLEPLFETDLGAPNQALAYRVAWGPDDELLTTTGGGGTIEVRRGPEYAVERSWTAHASRIYQLRFDRTGRRLVSAGGSVRVWDFATATELADLRDHGDPLCGAFSPDGTRLATGGRDNIVRIWETETYTQVGELHGHERYVHDLAWSPDGTQLVSVSGDSTVRIWETRSLAERREAIAERERLVRELRPRVEALFTELGDAGAVMTRLENDRDLSARAREVALQLAFGEAIARQPDGVRVEELSGE